MKRLTFDGLFCDIAKCDSTPGGTFCESGTCTQRRVWERLKKYEDAEQDGRLVVLPCKVGDTVYKLWYEPCHNGEDYPDSYGCCGCEDECDLKRSIFNFKVPSVDWILSPLAV